MQWADDSTDLDQQHKHLQSPPAPQEDHEKIPRIKKKKVAKLNLENGECQSLIPTQPSKEEDSSLEEPMSPEEF